MYTIGENPDPGTYRCILCHWSVQVQENDALPPCQECGTGGHVHYVIEKPELAVA